MVAEQRLGGAELPPPQKARFLEVQEELAKLASRFQDNVLDSTNAFGLYVTDPAELLFGRGGRRGRDQPLRVERPGRRAGRPELSAVLATAREGAKKDGRDGWKLTLHMPCYVPVMQYGDHHGLREKMYRAYMTRASELGPAQWDNSANIRRLLNGTESRFGRRAVPPAHP